jgi:hypothetical protein
MLSVLISLLQAARSSMRSQAALQLEILALRHQLQVLQRSRRRRGGLTQADPLLWVWLSRVWLEWRAAVVIVRPETVPTVLDMEESPSARPTTRPSGRPRPHPHDVARKPTLGCSADPW